MTRGNCFVHRRVKALVGYDYFMIPDFTGICQISIMSSSLPLTSLRTSAPAGLLTSMAQRARYATYFDVAVLRCLLQPHWTEEGVHWALMFYLQRLRQILEERPERTSEPSVTPLPRPRSSSMVAATPSLVNTHKTQVLAGRQRRINVGEKS